MYTDTLLFPQEAYFGAPSESYHMGITDIAFRCVIMLRHTIPISG